MRNKINFLVLLLVCSFITYYSVVPVPGSQSSPGFFSLHLLAYFVLAAAFLTNFHDSTRGHLEAVLAAFLFGLLLELIQLNLSSRYFSVRDIGMNLLGASIVLLDHHVGAITWMVEVEDRVLEDFREKTGL